MKKHEDERYRDAVEDPAQSSPGPETVGAKREEPPMPARERCGIVHDQPGVPGRARHETDAAEDEQGQAGDEARRDRVERRPHFGEGNTDGRRRDGFAAQEIQIRQERCGTETREKLHEPNRGQVEQRRRRGREHDGGRCDGRKLDQHGRPARAGLELVHEQALTTEAMEPPAECAPTGSENPRQLIERHEADRRLRVSGRALAERLQRE